jgi:DNA-binding MarR family transcriptional regulator
MASETRSEATQYLVRELLGVALAVRKRVRRALIERGHDLHSSHTAVVPNLPAEGLRLTELAAKLHVSVQRAGQLVQELADAGYVERIGDARDARAKLVRFSARGQRLQKDAAEVNAELWRELSESLGAARITRFAATIGAIRRALVGLDTTLLLEPRAMPRKPRKRLRRRVRSLEKTSST